MISEELLSAITSLKNLHPNWGRTRISRALTTLGFHLSQSTTSKALKHLGLTLPPKRKVSAALLSIECALPDSNDELTQRGIGMVLLHPLFECTLYPLLSSSLSPYEAAVAEVAAFCALEGRRPSLLQECLSPELFTLLGLTPPSPKKVFEALSTIGRNDREIVKCLIGAHKTVPQALALDEKVIEKWPSAPASTFPHHFVSRRHIAMPAVSVEVVGAIDKQTIARPLFHLFGDVKEEGKTDVQKIHEGTANEGSKEPCKNLKVHQEENHSKAKRQAQEGTQKVEGKRKVVPQRKTKKGELGGKGKRGEVVIPLLLALLEVFGGIMVPLRMDNRYGTKEIVTWLMKRGWKFIVHARSNLKIGARLKERMRCQGLKYAVEAVYSEEWGGGIRVAGYEKQGRIYVYLTNEEGSAKEVIKRYRARWRIENLFKYCTALRIVSGRNPATHSGQYLLALYYLSEVVEGFGASLETVSVLLNQNCRVRVKEGRVYVQFQNIRRRYARMLAKYIAYLRRTCKGARKLSCRIEW